MESLYFFLMNVFQLDRPLTTQPSISSSTRESPRE